MAAASGQQQNSSTTKKQPNPDQRKLFMGLGAVGVLALIAGAMYLPGIISGGEEVSAPPLVANSATDPSAANVASVDGSEVAAADNTGAPAAEAATTTTVAPPQALARFRRDPFQQAYFLPTPVPTLPPPPPPVALPSFSDEPALLLPGINGGNVEMQQPLKLPPVTINRLSQGARRPTDAFPPARTLGGAGSGVPNPSYDTRLSGVVIADGVRAILEIQNPNGPPTSRVVQPGDEIDGITVLNIQRFNDGTRTVTRMLIRENGEERTVELKAGLTPAQTGLGGISDLALPGGP